MALAPEREPHRSSAYEFTAVLHNDLLQRLTQ